MKISKIRLVNDGLKGLEVCYLKTEEKDGLTFQNEYSVKYKSPVHRELKKLIDSLDKYVVDVCRLADDAEVVVTGVTANDKQFLITAKSYVLENSVVSVNTPNIKEGMYEGFEEVQKIIDEIYKEVDIYVSKKKAIDQKQFVMDLFKNDAETLAGIDMNDPVALKEKMVAYLEKQGCIILEHDKSEDEDLKEEADEKSDPEVSLKSSEKVGDPDAKEKVSKLSRVG